jgi:hypothetical protein
MPGQPLAHQHRQRIRQRRIGAVGDLVVLAAMEMIVEHRGEVFRHARHPARADRLDAGLLDRLEHAARLRISRHQLAVHLWDRDRRASARSNRRGRARSPRRAWSSCGPGSGSRALPGARPGRSAANVTSSSGAFAIARRQEVTARLNGSVGASLDPVRNLELDVLIALS